jgi:hypothetical protein
LSFCLLAVLGSAALIIFIIFGGDMSAERALDRFAERVERGRLDDVRLVIYYMDPFIMSLPPTNIEWLVDGRHDLRVVVEGDALMEHTDRLRQINSNILISDNSKSEMHARIYFFFETTDGEKLFDVAMWMLYMDMFGPIGNILVNGQEFEMNYIFIDIIMPFLPEEEAELLQRFLDYDAI